MAKKETRSLKIRFRDFKWYVRCKLGIHKFVMIPELGEHHCYICGLDEDDYRKKKGIPLR